MWKRVDISTNSAPKKIKEPVLQPIIPFEIFLVYKKGHEGKSGVRFRGSGYSVIFSI